MHKTVLCGLELQSQALDVRSDGPRLRKEYHSPSFYYLKSRSSLRDHHTVLTVYCESLFHVDTGTWCFPGVLGAKSSQHDVFACYRAGALDVQPEETGSQGYQSLVPIDLKPLMTLALFRSQAALGMKGIRNHIIVKSLLKSING